MYNIVDIIKKDSYIIGGLFYGFSISFYPKVATIALVLWFLVSVLSIKHAPKLNKNFYVFALLYLSYVLSVFLSDVKAFKYLEYKLSFLIFPLIFSLHNYTFSNYIRLFKYYIYGLLSSSFFCLCIAIYRSISIGVDGIVFKANVLNGYGFFDSIIYGGNYFFGSQFSVFQQTVYYAMYLCLGAAILLFTNVFKIKLRVFFLMLIGVLIFVISNKAGVIVFFTLLLIKSISFGKNKTIKIFAFCSIILIASGVLVLNPRYNESLRKILNGNYRIDKSDRYDFKTRLLSWDASIELIKDKPILGYGVGDTQNVLNDKYEEKGYVSPLKKSLNAHNEFMQIWLENGVLGILLLLFLYGLLFKEGLKSKNHRGLIVGITWIFFINSLFESVFNRFSGISVFMFFCILMLSINKKEQIKKEAFEN